MDNRAIGIFDSGLGGLTAVSALRQLMPMENIIYFADSARVPYGEKSPQELNIMARQDLELLSSKGAKAIIAACGTVSSNASKLLDAYPVPCIGVLRPSVDAMAKLGGEAPLAVIATEASIRSGSFKAALESRCPGREILAIPCPDFVPLIEGGHVQKEDELLMAAVERALAPAKAAGIAALLLGCTHYGLISEALSAYLGRDVALVSASYSAAVEMKERAEALGIQGGEGRLEFYTSGDAEEFSAAASRLLGLDIKAQHVDI